MQTITTGIIKRVYVYFVELTSNCLGRSLREATRRTCRTCRQITTHKALRCIHWRRVRQVRRVDLGFIPWGVGPSGVEASQ